MDKYGQQLKPQQSEEDLHLRYIYWLHFGDGRLVWALQNLFLYNGRVG